MRRGNRRCAVVTAAVAVVGATFLSAEEKEQANGDRPRIEMAILLDTSGSMSGLINQARAQLWSVVNEFITAERNGLKPELRVALYEYGNSGRGKPESGWVRQIVPLSDDLDKISQELFALTTNGGSEHCGQVIQAAVEQLKWSASNDDLKVIYIAGNEPFTQGPVDYAKACKAAVSKGIIVNTIHCGSDQAGIDGKWKDGAVLADGSYASIDHNQAIVSIPAPQDKEIAELNEALNKTYIPYGKQGVEMQARQTDQDANAVGLGSTVAAQRAMTKASFNYTNAGWDLVDAVDQERVELADVKVDDLPENMRSMTAEQRQAHVEKMAASRAGLQKRISELAAGRQKFVDREMEKRARETGEETLQMAVVRSIRQQAAEKKIEFKPAPVTER